LAIAVIVEAITQFVDEAGMGLDARPPYILSAGCRALAANADTTEWAGIDRAILTGAIGQRREV
jgi:hypothetical protein